jgi:2-keto-4-pentenoate hydratase/2-oxohepta-3-ene-1,7-dioic acid hydratase in catechol pathway
MAQNIANNHMQGPVAVSAAALPEELRIRTFVNGEIRQDGTTSDLITSISKIIEVVSSGITLQPGDVIATGTPHGVGVGFRPPKFLNPGDLGNVLSCYYLAIVTST